MRIPIGSRNIAWEAKQAPASSARSVLGFFFFFFLFPPPSFPLSRNNKEWVKEGEGINKDPGSWLQGDRGSGWNWGHQWFRRGVFL